MCLAVPAQVTELHEDRMATVSLAGVTRRVSVDLVEGVGVGDWVAVHVGFALHKIDEQEARETLALFESIAEALAELGAAPDQGEPAVEPEPPPLQECAGDPCAPPEKEE